MLLAFTVDHGANRRGSTESEGAADMPRIVAEMW